VNPASRLVYLVGAPNCGSTMLDAILGNAPGAFSLGEAAGFHRFREEDACACGERPASCGPCRAVVDAWSQAAGVDQAAAVFERPTRGRCLHWLLVPTAARREYARLAGVQVEAVSRATGAGVLVDSSKNVGRAAALLLDGGHDVRFVHLVRGVGGHVRSRRRRPDARRWRGTVPIVTQWAAKNLVIALVLRARAGRQRFLTCRYEELVSAPARVLERIGAFADLDTSGLAAAATGSGVRRTHLFERPRRFDYHLVTIDPGRARR
jgi:Sulfotransferase family